MDTLKEIEELIKTYKRVQDQAQELIDVANAIASRGVSELTDRQLGLLGVAQNSACSTFENVE
jgi:hypothetical protein